MAKFQYATKDGKLKTFEAANTQAAQSMVAGFTDAAPRSGVMVVADQPAAAVITKNGKVDVSKIPASDVKPYAEPTAALTVVRTRDNKDGTTTNYLSDGTQERGKYTRNADGTRNFVAVDTPGAMSFAELDFQELAPEEQLSRQGSTVRAEIAAIEERMAGRAGQRNDALDDAGVFDDMRELNKLKDELRAAEDRQIEIPIEERQKLRGRQATKREFDQGTRPELEKAVLGELVASRRTSRLTDTINTNIAVVDSFIEAETARDEFLYQQKQKRLETITTVYGNIITEKQKAALEEKKFQNELILESIRTDNSLRSDLIKGIAEQGIGGAQLQGIMSASVDELLQFRADLSGSQNWTALTPEQAAITLTPDQFTRYTKYREMAAEDQAAADAGLAVQSSAQGVISTIEGMLNDTQGLKTSVGLGLGNMDINLFGFGKESAQFRALAKQLTSQTTLTQLAELKAKGATLGAISEKELQILGTAGQALGGILDEQGNQTGRFEMPEEQFKTMLETMRIASMKTYIAATIGKDAYQRAGYLNADFATVQKRYTDLIENPPQAVDYYQSDFAPQNVEAAADVIREEEGLRTSAYQDTTGKWTIGFGNTMINGRPVQPGDRLSVAQAEALLQNSIVKDYTTFASVVSRPISPNQFAALASFEYNLGGGVWDKPTGQQILALVDKGDTRAAGNLMLQYSNSYNPATGRLEPNPVLAKRRAREAQLLLA